MTTPTPRTDAIKRLREEAELTDLKDHPFTKDVLLICDSVEQLERELNQAQQSCEAWNNSFNSANNECIALKAERDQWKEDAERLSKQLKSRCEGDWSATDVLTALSLHEQLVKETNK